MNIWILSWFEFSSNENVRLMVIFKTVRFFWALLYKHSCITQDTAFSLPVWCRRRWTPRSRPPRWLSAGTARILRCCHRRSFPTWRPWRCWWSCRRSGWCQTPPLPRLCQQFPDKKQRGTVRSWFMTLDGNSKLIGRETWRLACLKDDYVLLIFSFIFLSTNSVWRMKNQQWIDPDT